MKLLKILVVLVLLLAGASLALPDTYEVSRSVVISAPSAAIHKHIADLREWKQWAVWNQRDPAMAVEYSEPSAGPDAHMSWKSETEGEGEMTVTASDPDKGLWIDLSFEQGKYLSKGAIMYETVPEGTKVTWINSGGLGMNPVARYMGLMFDTMMGPDFQANLDKLKQIVEGA